MYITFKHKSTPNVEINVMKMLQECAIYVLGLRPLTLVFPYDPSVVATYSTQQFLCVVSGLILSHSMLSVCTFLS